MVEKVKREFFDIDQLAMRAMTCTYLRSHLHKIQVPHNHICSKLPRTLFLLQSAYQKRESLAELEIHGFYYYSQSIEAFLIIPNRLSYNP